jgi:serine/threonine protein phosphatase 1
MITVGDTMFVHAGVVPGVDPQVTLNDTGLDKLVWIREPFLTLGPKLDKWTNTIKKVVHGHSIQENLPDVGNQRVGIDTGAFYTGILTTYNATQDTYHQIVKPANPLYR